MSHKYVLLAVLLITFLGLQKAGAEEIDFKKATKPRIYNIVLFRPDDPVIRGQGVFALTPNGVEPTNNSSGTTTSTTGNNYTAITAPNANGTQGNISNNNDGYNANNTTHYLLPTNLFTSANLSVLYPNPVSNWAVIDIHSALPVQIDIFNTAGQCVLSQLTSPINSEGVPMSLDLGYLPNGNYVLKAYNKDVAYAQKIQVRH